MFILLEIRSAVIFTLESVRMAYGISPACYPMFILSVGTGHAWQSYVVIHCSLSVDRDMTMSLQSWFCTSILKARASAMTPTKER